MGVDLVECCVVCLVWVLDVDVGLWVVGVGVGKVGG